MFWYLNFHSSQRKETQKIKELCMMGVSSTKCYHCWMATKRYPMYLMEPRTVAGIIYRKSKSYFHSWNCHSNLICYTLQQRPMESDLIIGSSDHETNFGKPIMVVIWSWSWSWFSTPRCDSSSLKAVSPSSGPATSFPPQLLPRTSLRERYSFTKTFQQNILKTSHGDLLPTAAAPKSNS